MGSDSARRLGYDRLSLADLLFVSNDMYLHRPSPRMQRLAAPLLAELMRDRGAATVGLHLRVGDSALPNAVKKNNIRYPPECVRAAPAPSHAQDVVVPRQRWHHFE